MGWVTDDTIWDICFKCQISTRDKVHSSTGGYKTLAKNILGFHKKEKLQRTSIFRELLKLIWTYYDFWQQTKQFITTFVSRSISIRN